MKVLYRPADDTLVECQTLEGQLICTAQADYFIESGNLSDDMDKLNSAKKKILLMAEQGSSEVGETPQFQSIVDVARNKYGGAASAAADKFLAQGEIEDNRQVVGISRTVTQKSVKGLKNPLFAGIED